MRLFGYRYACQIVLQIRDLMRELPSLVDIHVPDGKHFTVCGDVHGQVVPILYCINLSSLVCMTIATTGNGLKYMHDHNTSLLCLVNLLP